MPAEPPKAPSWSVLESARARLGLSLEALWIGYFAIGGNAPLTEVEGWLSGAPGLTVTEYDFMAQALNDESVQRGLGHPVPYSDSAA